jgi:hypothetical protein
VEYALLLVLVDSNPAAGIGYQICEHNPSRDPETAIYEIDPSDIALPPERIEVEIGPGETHCEDFVPQVGGVVKRIVRGPPSGLETYGGSGGNTVRTQTCGGAPPFLQKVIQIYLVDTETRTRFASMVIPSNDAFIANGPPLGP